MSDIVDLMHATVKLEQPLGNGRTVGGTAFVVRAASKNGSPRVILVTANHVFARMSRDKVRVGFRNWSRAHGWKYAPVQVRIRDAEGKPLWTKHPTQDVATLPLPNGVSPTALPISELPGERALEKLTVQPGDEMMALGYPHGVAANDAGFPILRSGKVASYPLSPADRYPTYLVDIDVYAGNSGGPVYMPIRSIGPKSAHSIVITGILTQQIKYNEQRLAIGNVTQADFISETVSLMQDVEPLEASAAPVNDLEQRMKGEPVPVGSPDRSAQDRLRDAWRTFKEDVAVLVQRTWIVIRDWTMSIVTPDAHRLTR